MVRYSKILLLVLFLVVLSSCKNPISKLQETKEICLADKGIIPAKTTFKANTSSSEYPVSENEDAVISEDSPSKTTVEQPENPIQSQQEYPESKSETKSCESKTKLKTFSIQAEAEAEVEATNPNKLIKSSTEACKGTTTPESCISQPDTEVVHCNENDTVSSSCLPPAGLKLPACQNNPPSNSEYIPEEDSAVIKVPARNRKNRTRKRKVGSVFPTSILEFQESNELIVKGDISIEEIENLIEDNPIENSQVLNTEEGILRKIDFRYPLKAEDYNKLKDHLIAEVGIASFEPNFYINDLAMEANSSVCTIDLLAENWALRDLGLMHSEGEGGEGVIVAVIDTGVDPDLVDNINRGWNFVDNNNDTMDHHGHGTHVFGITRSVVPGRKIMPIKALDDDGSGNPWNLARAIIYAVDNGVKVINMSWGSSTRSIAIDHAIDYAYRKGVILCAAAGNNGADTPLYPASNHKVISVGAYDICGIPTRWTSGEADFIGPGKDISSISIYTEHEYKSGTSMSTAYVSGIAALFLEKNPDSGPMEFLYNARVQAKENASLNGFGLLYPEYFVPGCNRILFAFVDGIRVLTYAEDIEYSLLEYKRDGEKDWTAIAQVAPSTEERNIPWDRRKLPNGFYKIRLRQFPYDGGVRKEVTDTMPVEITDGLPNNESTSQLFWGWCKIDDSYIVVDNPNIEITPAVVVDGKQIFSSFTAITQKAKASFKLSDYLPKEYEGFIVLDVTGDSEISLVTLTRNMEKNLIRIDESAKNLGAEWYLSPPGKNQQDNLWNAFLEYPENRDSFENYRFDREATIELCSYTNEADGAYITLSADNVEFRPADLWYWDEDNEYYFYIPGGMSYLQSAHAYNYGESYRFPAYSEVHEYHGEDLVSMERRTEINPSDYLELMIGEGNEEYLEFESIVHEYHGEDLVSMERRTEINPPDLSLRIGEEDEEYLEFESIMNYLFPYSRSYRLVAKLGDRLDAEYINLVINKPLVGSVKTWSFFEGPDVPINFFWANRCEVSSNGGLFGAVVVRERGEVVEVIPLERTGN